MGGAAPADMRPPLLILFSLGLALAGCTKNNATPGDNSTATTKPTTNSTTPTTPVLKQPKEVKAGTQDFAGNTPAQPIAAIPITIDDGYANVLLNVTFSCMNGAPACVAANGVSVKAAGLACSLPDGPLQAAITCTKPGSASPGAGKIEFTGNGLVSAKYAVIES